MVFRDKYHRGRELFSLHYIRVTQYWHDLLLMILTLITWKRYCLPSVSIVRLLFFPFHTLFFGSGWLGPLHTQHMCAHGGGRGRFSFISWRQGTYICYLEFFYKNNCVLSSCIYLFTNLFVSIVDLQIFILYFGL